jgi:hypothetical protein
MEMLVNIYKNWLDDAKVGTMSMEKFMEIENILVEENKNGMGKIRLLEMDDNTNGL